jgi:hypothetical protein
MIATRRSTNKFNIIKKLYIHSDGSILPISNYDSNKYSSLRTEFRPICVKKIDGTIFSTEYKNVFNQQDGSIL